MMTVQDVLNNWLQLKLVADIRPDDEAAQVSLEHITEILNKEYKKEVKEVVKEEEFYKITYCDHGQSEVGKTSIHRVPAQSAEVLLHFINENAERYNFNER